jgi:hypothetical protein
LMVVHGEDVSMFDEEGCHSFLAISDQRLASSKYTTRLKLSDNC